MEDLRIIQRLLIALVFTLSHVLFSAGLLAQSADQPSPQKNENSHSPKVAKRTPLIEALKDGIPKNSVKRAQVRDNLYALLATAEDPKSAQRIEKALAKLYLTSGSPTVDILMRRGVQAINADKYVKALEFLNAVTELAPDYAEGWNQRAFTFYKQNDIRKAAGDLRRVLALDPNHIRALEGLGTILREVGDNAGAYKVFQKLIAINPNAEDARKAIKDLKRKVEGRRI